MIDPLHVPPVDDDELLARFIVNSNEVRADRTVRPQLFLPYSRVELSVNRHRDASSDETWAVGFQVAEQRGKQLLGRADVLATACRIPPLEVVPKPHLPHNPNHADITGFPTSKADQMSLALQLAAAIEGPWTSPP